MDSDQAVEYGNLPYKPWESENRRGFVALKDRDRMGLRSAKPS